MYWGELHIDVDAGRSGNVQHRGLHIEELTGGSQIDRDGAGAGIIDLEALGDIALAQAVEDVVDSLVFLRDVLIWNPATESMTMLSEATKRKR